MLSLPSFPVARRALAIAVAGSALAASADRGATANAAQAPAPTSFDAHPGRAATTPHPATEALRKALGDQGLVSSDPRTGTVRAAGKLDGALTGPSDEDGAAIALGYVREHGPALGLPAGEAPGLALERRTVTGGGLEVLTWRQRRGGIPSADTYLRAAVDADGRLLSLTGAPDADLDPPTLRPGITAAAALAAVSGAPAPKGERRGNDPERHTTFTGGATASLVLYQGGDGARLGWRVVAPLGPAELADAIVDAAEGTVVERANRVKFAYPSAKVFLASPDASGGVQSTVNFYVWGTAADRLLGTRVHAFADVDGVVDPSNPGAVPDATPAAEWTRPLLAGFPGCPRCTWADGAFAQNKDQSATQLYYAVNAFLDHLAASPIGFTDATGGYGPGDRIVAQAMDGAADGTTNNASFLAFPDGGPGFLEVHLFDADDRLDGANDVSLVFHEVAHGLTERLVTDGQGVGALRTAQAHAIAEGTSDFLALDRLVQQSYLPDDPDVADVRFGAYLGDWLRSAPIDALSGYGYDDFGELSPDGPEPHYDGEIWAQTLWSLRTAIGITATRRVLVDGLRIVPPDPSFLDLRNAMLVASQDGATDDAIWAVFAARGMGYRASTDGSDDPAPVPDGTVPNDLGPADKVLTGTVTDEDGRPLPGVRVGIAGLDTDGLGALLTDETDANGVYAITGHAGTHELLRGRKPGYREVRTEDVTFPGTVPPLVADRDWSSSVGGARVTGFTGPDHSADGCGPAGLIDDDRATVWSTDRSDRSVTIELPAPIDVWSISIDPTAGCGDEPSSALGDALLEVATSPGAFRPVASPAFNPGDLGTLTDALAGTPAPTAVRYVRLTAIESQKPTVSSGKVYVDAAELEVLKVRGSALGPTVTTGGATAIGAMGATLTGTVAPNGGAAPDVVFEYGTTAAYGSLVAASGSPGVQAAVTGLQPSTTYHYRVVALRGGRRYEGGDATFTTGPATPPSQPPPAGSASIAGKKVRATRKGVFKVKVRFDPGAPKGMARVQAKRKGKVVARGKREVAPGQTRRVTMRLNKAGRRAIKPGRSRKVTIVLWLPDADDPVRQTLTVARKR